MLGGECKFNGLNYAHRTLLTEKYSPETTVLIIFAMLK